MRATLGVLGLVASCYSPHPPAGAPCSPSAPSCPAGQSCALVGGSYVCTDGVGGDAGADGPPADTSAVGVDGAVDAPAMPRWTLIQTEGDSDGTVPIAASGAGHLIVVAVETTAAGAVTSVADNAGNSYVAVAGARATNALANRGVELWYAKSSLAGATLVTASAPTVLATVMWEVAGIDPTSPLDKGTKLDDQAASTMPLGASITTSAAGEFVVSVVIVSGSVSGIHAGSLFTNDHRTFGNGWAHLTDPASAPGTYQAQWDQVFSGGSCASSAAFFVGP